MEDTGHLVPSRAVALPHGDCGICDVMIPFQCPVLIGILLDLLDKGSRCYVIARLLWRHSTSYLESKNTHPLSLHGEAKAGREGGRSVLQWVIIENRGERGGNHP